MSNLTANDTRGLMEAYAAVYDQDLREQLEEDKEVQELTLQIIENAAYVLFSQGYDVDDVISYFTEATEDVISEDFVNFAEGNLLIESVAVSDDYIIEQFEVLNEILGKLAQGAIKLGAKVFGAGAGAMKGGAGAKGALGAMAKSTGRSLKHAATGAKELIKKVPGAVPAGKLISRAAPGVGAALYGMDAVGRAKKGDYAGAALSGLGAGLSLVPGVGALTALAPAGVQMATDAMGLTGDKSKKGPSAKPAPAAPSLKAKQDYAKSKGKYYSSSDQKTYANYNDALAARNSRRGVKPAAPAAPAAPAGNAKPAPAKPAPAKPATAKLGNTPYEVRTPNRAELKGAQEYRAANPNAKPEDVLKAAQLRGKQQASVDADIAKFNKPEELNKRAPAGSALRAQQDAQAKKAEEEKKRAAEKAAAGTTKESYDAYDVVLEYLVSGGHVESVSEAHYVMLEMDSETIQNIVEAQRARENPERYEREERSKETRGQSAERRVRDRLRTMDPEKAAKMRAQMRAVGLNV